MLPYTDSVYLDQNINLSDLQGFLYIGNGGIVRIKLENEGKGPALNRTDTRQSLVPFSPLLAS